VTGPAHPVSWAPGPPMPQAWPSSPRPALPLPAVLRVGAGALLALAGVLVAGGTFPRLVAISDDRNRYELSGWSETVTGTLSADPMHLGIPLVVAAALLLGGAGLAIASLWRPGLRSGALTAAVVAAGFVTAQFWALASYVGDVMGLADAAGDSVSSSRGAGFWLELTGMVLGLLALVVLIAAELAALRRPAVAPPTWSPPPIAGPPDWIAAAPAAPTAWEATR
jgi:hypothetical protein